MDYCMDDNYSISDKKNDKNRIEALAAAAKSNKVLFCPKYQKVDLRHDEKRAIIAACSCSRKQLAR